MAAIGFVDLGGGVGDGFARHRAFAGWPAALLRDGVDRLAVLGTLVGKRAGVTGRLAEDGAVALVSPRRLEESIGGVRGDLLPVVGFGGA